MNRKINIRSYGNDGCKDFHCVSLQIADENNDGVHISYFTMKEAKIIFEQLKDILHDDCPEEPLIEVKKASSERKMVDYIIVLEVHVEKYLEEGWEPLGQGIVTIESDGTFHYHQTMVKYE